MPSKRPAIKLYCSTEEAATIAESASKAGLSVSTFLRRVALGYEVPSREDAQARRELLKVNADIARLGSLLKIALSHERGDEVRELIGELATRQMELKEAVSRI